MEPTDLDTREDILLNMGTRNRVTLRKDTHSRVTHNKGTLHKGILQQVTHCRVPTFILQLVTHKDLVLVTAELDLVRT